MRVWSAPSVVYLLGVVASLLTGCGRSTPARFYVLSPLPRGEQAVASDKPLVIGIGPVVLPPYLDRPQIVSRPDPNRLALAEFDRWAEPLASGFSRVLVENVSSLLGTERVVLLPWKHASNVKYRVAVNVIRFDGLPGKQASLTARWTVFGADGNELVPMRRSSILVKTQGSGFAGLTAAMSEAVASLGREIATVIRASDSTP